MPIGSRPALSAAQLVFVKEYICVGFLNLQTKRSSCQCPHPDMADAPLLPSFSSTAVHPGLAGSPSRLTLACRVCSPTVGAQAVDIHKVPSLMVWEGERN